MRKFLLTLAVLCGTVGAWADITQNYYLNCNFWQNATSIPTEVEEVLNTATINDKTVKKEGGVIQWSNNTITIDADGDVVVTFTHNGGQHMLNMLGVDVIDANGTVISSDYHYGTAGGNHTDNVYTLQNLKAGSTLTLRCFVYDNTGTNDRTNSAQGYYVITNVSGDAIPVVKAAVNLANGKYIFRQAGGDVALYNGSDVARGKTVADAGDVNHVFTITTGGNGYYTIQTADGKFVTYTGTGNTSTIAMLSAEEATEDNKWWSIREGNETSQRTIVPKSNDVYNAPGWNYAKSVDGKANRAVALWSSSDNGSQWYITRAAVVNEGYAKVKNANVYLTVDGDRIKKGDNNGENSVLKFTRGENGCYTIQTLDGRYITYKGTGNGDNIVLNNESDATDENKWWVLTYDLQTRKDGALDIIPSQDNIGTTSPAFNWSVETNTILGLWHASDNNSFFTIEESYIAPANGGFVAFQSASSHNYCAGKYVKTVPVVKNYSGAGYSANRDHTQLVFDDCDPATTPSAVFEVLVGEKPYEYKLKNVHTQEYVASFVKNAKHMSTENEAVVVKFVALGENQVAVYGANNGAPMHAQEAYNVIVTWDSGLNSASAWYIKEVDNFAHTLSIGDAEWSSLMLGYNAEIPASVKAYVVETVNTESVKLAEVSGVLAANTPILVNAEKAEYTFAYSAEEATITNNGKLAGTLYDTNVATDAYVLSMVDAKVGLYKAAKNQLDGTAFKNNANKAYLPAPAEAPIRFLVFNFGEETGIESVEGAENGAEEIVFDLAGRRVQNAQKGVFIVNGKVVIK
ncbi:MAG: hypothetical protein UH687_08705 [Bacteroidaceae bacterium]|nr:hypothetical protein [Bacteroidaceae bacterium]